MKLRRFFASVVFGATLLWSVMANAAFVVDGTLYATNVQRISTTEQYSLQLVNMASESVVVQGHNFTSETRPDVNQYVSKFVQDVETYLVANHGPGGEVDPDPGDNNDATIPIAEFVKQLRAEADRRLAPIAERYK